MPRGANGDKASEVSAPRLTIRNLRAVGVEVPMTYVLGTSAAAVRAAAHLSTFRQLCGTLPAAP